MLNMNAARVRVAVKISQLDKDVLDTLSVPRSEYIRVALEEKLAREVPGYDQARHEVRDWTGTGWPDLPLPEQSR